MATIHNLKQTAEEDYKIIAEVQAIQPKFLINEVFDAYRLMRFNYGFKLSDKTELLEGCLYADIYMHKRCVSSESMYINFYTEGTTFSLYFTGVNSDKEVYIIRDQKLSGELGIMLQGNRQFWNAIAEETLIFPY